MVVVISKNRLSAKTLILISKPSLKILLGLVSFHSNRLILKEAPMFQRNGVGLDWSTFFSLTKEQKSNFLKQIKTQSLENYNYEQQNLILFPEDKLSRKDEIFDQAFEIEILNFCIEESNFAFDILSEEDYGKCCEQLKRKQYNSKLLKYVLSALIYLIYHFARSLEKKLSVYLERDTLKRTNELREQEAEKKFSPLKKQIEKIAAGVKGCCYLATDRHSYGFRVGFDVQIKSELNDYAKKKWSYDFNTVNGYGNVSLLSFFGNQKYDVNAILQQNLLNDNEFWETHKEFNILTFLDVVYKLNDPRHAEKILDCIFTEISKNQYGKIIIEKSLPLVTLKKDNLLSGLEWRTFRFTFERFKGECDLKFLSGKNLCYPFAPVDNVETKLQKGKQLTEEFLREIYPEDYNGILKILQDEINHPSTAFSCKKNALCNVNGENVISNKDFDEWNIRHIFDYPTFGYHTRIVARDVVEVYCPEYFSPQHIWNRFYLKAFYMFELVNNKRKCFANLFEVYYDLFQFLEEKTEIRTSHQRNTEGREEAFLKLRAILQSKGINISEKYKSDYIIAFLDRKVAIREEAERFPILEQLGDAVYGLAVAEMLFYNPDEEDFAKDYESYICAAAQIKISQKFGFDKLYLSSYSLPRTYESDTLINPDKESYKFQEERGQLNNDKKYLADSLEMIIGTVCKDCGYKSAFNFSKQLLKETYPNKFQSELHWDDDHNEDIDRDYWTRILPAPYSHFDTAHHTLWQAFDKFFKTYVLGTEDISTRQFITNNFGDNKLYDVCGEHFKVNQVFYEYLHKSLESAIEKYGNSIKEKYKELNK